MWRPIYQRRYRSFNIYRIWIPSLAKVISTRNVVFDEQAVFDGKVEDLMDSLMHNTLEEIATRVRIMELPNPTAYPEIESFFENDNTEDSAVQQDDSDPPGYHQGRKIMGIYPTPPPTPPPPAALLAGLMAGDQTWLTPHGSSKTVPRVEMPQTCPLPALGERVTKPFAALISY
jgi:hypothetical protein